MTGLAFWGGVEVKVKPPKTPKPVKGTRPNLRKEL